MQNRKPRFGGVSLPYILVSLYLHGSPGFWVCGTPLWLFESHPVLVEIEEEFVRNRNNQI